MPMCMQLTTKKCASASHFQNGFLEAEYQYILTVLSQTEFLFTLNIVFKFNLAFFFLILLYKDSVMLNGFGTVVNALGKRVKPYLPQICGTVLWRLNNKSAKVRQQAADLISRTAVVMKTCQEVNFYIRFLIIHQKKQHKQ